MRPSGAVHNTLLHRTFLDEQELFFLCPMQTAVGISATLAIRLRQHKATSCGDDVMSGIDQLPLSWLKTRKGPCGAGDQASHLITGHALSVEQCPLDNVR